MTATASPSMDIQVSSNFERLLFDAYGRDAAAVRALMGSLAQSRQLHHRAAGARRDPRALHRRARRRGRDRRDHPHGAARGRLSARSAHRGGASRSPRRKAATARCRWWCSPPRIRRNSPPRSRPPAACSPQLPDWLGDLDTRPERVTVLPADQGAVEKFITGGEPCRARRSCRMSMDVTRLPSGLVVVTDAMPHLQSASLGVWVGAGSRDEHADEHGISHLLEHMAFKGTARRTARQIAEEIEAVGGDLNAATSVESTAYYARVLRADVPLALDVLSDILTNPTFEPEELAREKNVIVQEIGATEDTPDDLIFEYLQAVTFPDQPVGRSILGTPEIGALVRLAPPARLSGAQLPRARHGDRGGGRGRSPDDRRGSGAPLRGASPGPEAPLPRAGDIRRRRAHRAARSRAGARRLRARRRAAARSLDLQPAGLHQHARRRDVVAPVPGSARDPRALLLDLCVPCGLCGHRRARRLCRHRRVRPARADARRGRRDRQRGRNASPRPRSRAPRRR